MCVREEGEEGVCERGKSEREERVRERERGKSVCVRERRGEGE